MAILDDFSTFLVIIGYDVSKGPKNAVLILDPMQRLNRTPSMVFGDNGEGISFRFYF